MPAYNSQLFNPPAPVAEVRLRNPETRMLSESVFLLIDSGAVVTLLPPSAIESLGISAKQEKGYELKAFDGSLSVSQAVRADLLWQKKTFRGEFLLINQEIGFLGRDILNHLPIFLDGPRLTWEIR